MEFMNDTDDLLFRHYIVNGQVQGVFYRASAADRAQGLNLRGWVRNMPDGRVEVRVAGPSQVLEQFQQWLNEGPPAAEVSDVVVKDIAPEALPYPFVIRR